MITWMQRHKKYLVVTIWISVIAFVGAGTVGWGSVDLSSKSKYVAEVGKIGITKKEFQDRFNKIYAIQSASNGGNLTQEEAIKNKFDIKALMELIQEKLILNYAYDLGFYASDEEVLKSITKETDFQTDGKFDKNKYFTILKNNRIKTSDFEEEIRENIIINKVFDLLQNPVSDEELQLITASLFLEDEVNVKVINLDKKAISINEEEMKKYWEEHKDNYKSKQTNEFSIYIVSPDLNNINEDELYEFWQPNKYNYKDLEGKIKEFDAVKNDIKVDFALQKTELNAKKQSILLKKKEVEFQEKVVEDFNSELSMLTKELKIGEVSKPFIKDKKYYIVRLDKVNLPSTLDYNEAKSMVKEDFEDVKYKEKLISLAKDELDKKTLNGKNIGFVSKFSQNNTDILSDIEFFIFINELFSKNDKKSFVLLSDKAIVYEIMSQKLINNDELEKNKELLKYDLNIIKANSMTSELLEALTKRYKVINYYKGSEF